MISRIKWEGIIMSGVVISTAPFSRVALLSDVARHCPATVGG
jgi:hypothetical protein